MLAWNWKPSQLPKVKMMALAEKIPLPFSKTCIISNSFVNIFMIPTDKWSSYFSAKKLLFAIVETISEGLQLIKMQIISEYEVPNSN